MNKILRMAVALLAFVMTSRQATAQIETPYALLNNDATWSQVHSVSADYALSTDLNGPSSISFKLVDATRYSPASYNYDVILELVHSDGTERWLGEYHYQNETNKGWAYKSENGSLGEYNGSVTTRTTPGSLVGELTFEDGRNGDKVRLTIKNIHTIWPLDPETYYTTFEVRTLRFDLYDDYELLGSGDKQNNLKDHTTPITVYVHRNLNSANWSTICLPFDLPYSQIESVFGAGTIVSKFTSIDLEQHYVNFYTAPVQSEGIKAGHPYLIKPGEDFTYTDNPLFFTDVQISASVTAGADSDTGGYGYSFVGIMQPTVLKNTVTTDQVPVYISSNQFYKDTGDEPMKGFRAYFKFPAVYPGNSNPAKRMMLNIEEDLPTAINDVRVDGQPTAPKVYNLNGQYVGNSLKGLPKGIYIVNGQKVALQ